ncbi:MAG: 2-oxo acid dehydrogenase subunit E2 [Actinomycetota bacterium]|nr:2-oxo acid dehydrogenase subunit E2 [Actinomycetota bacterium]
MVTLMRMPEVAAGATEAILVEWLVPEDVPFAQGDPIVVIETEKAVVEVEAESSARIVRTLAQAGSTVEVGAAVALLAGPQEQVADVDAALAELGVQGASAATIASPDPGGLAGVRLLATPLVRRLAAEAGLHLEGVTGSGPSGRIVRRDIEQVLGDGAVAGVTRTPIEGSAPAPGRGQRRTGTGAFEDLPHSPLRRAVARRLSESKQTVPHFYLRATVDVERLLALRAEINGVAGQKVSVNDLMLKAVALAHVRVPDMNVIWTEDATRRYAGVDVSVAIATPRGLFTPVLRDVDSLSVAAIADAVRRFVALAEERRLQQDDLEGGTITVTNLGMYGVEEFAAIINPPQAAILAVGAARSEPVVTGGQVRAGIQMSLVLSVDHRVVDGALAASWMQTLREIVEAPVALLL